MRYHKHHLIVLFYFPVMLSSCSTQKADTLKPIGLVEENTVTVQNGNLKVVFIDNKEAPPYHKAGYNGIAELSHAEEDSVLFVPAYAGFNLEHVFGGDSLAQLFEPRLHPMTLFRKSDNEVLLYQEATPISGVESLTEFKVVDPHYIDVTFRCIIHNADFFKHDYAGLFWASYIQRPEDKKIYFTGVEENNPDTTWIAAYSTEHGVQSTHRSVQDHNEIFFAENFNARLASHFSNYRFILPFYFGRFGKMTLAYFFDSNEIIRFSQSPTGGGETNPAWDFQYIIPNPKTGQEYSFKARMVYKPFISEQDIMDEYKNWKEKK